MNRNDMYFDNNVNYRYYQVINQSIDTILKMPDSQDREVLTEKMLKLLKCITNDAVTALQLYKCYNVELDYYKFMQESAQDPDLSKLFYTAYANTVETVVPCVLIGNDIGD